MIALFAAIGDLALLNGLYSRILVPFEVCSEIMSGGQSGFTVPEFQMATFLEKRTKPTTIGTFLYNSLDIGEASVIQSALDFGITTVCIDEAVGRRIARLNDLIITGSIGILIRAKQEGAPISIRTALDNMHRHGIWLSNNIADAAIKLSEE